MCIYHSYSYTNNSNITHRTLGTLICVNIVDIHTLILIDQGTLKINKTDVYFHSSYANPFTITK